MTPSSRRRRNHRTGWRVLRARRMHRRSVDSEERMRGGNTQGQVSSLDGRPPVAVRRQGDGRSGVPEASEHHL